MKLQAGSRSKWDSQPYRQADDLVERRGDDRTWTTLVEQSLLVGFVARQIIFSAGILRRESVL